MCLLHLIMYYESAHDTKLTILLQVCMMSLSVTRMPLTTVYWLLVMVQIQTEPTTGWWRTHGVPPGATKVTSRWSATTTTSVVLPALHHSLWFKHNSIHTYSFIYLSVQTPYHSPWGKITVLYAAHSFRWLSVQCKLFISKCTQYLLEGFCSYWSL